jgi:hypothetical protein
MMDGAYGGQSAADEILAKAEAIVDRLAREYPFHAIRDLAELERFAERMITEKDARAAHYGEIARIAHDMKGQGAVFGYPMVTRLAASLCRATRTIGAHDRAVGTIIRAHLAAMQAMLDHRITDQADPAALAMAAGLEMMVESRFRDQRE